MTQHAPPPHSFCEVPLTRDKHRSIPLKNFAESGLDHKLSARRTFAALLWKAFPGPSENDVAEKAARVLDVTPRQVRNWLRCENSAAWHYVSAVMLIAGAEIVFQKVEARS